MLTDDSYLPGVQVLVDSLRKHSDRQLVVLCSSDAKSLHRATIIQLYKLPNLIIKMVPPIPNLQEEESIKEGEPKPSWVGSAYTKLHIWNMLEYEKVLYIDADCLIMDKVDQLLELDCDFAAAPDVFPPDHFNAGVLLVKPSLRTFKILLARTRMKEFASYDKGDTGFLNASFQKTWYNQKEEFPHAAPD